MQNTYEAPQAEVISISLSRPIADNTTDGVVDANNTLPPLS